MNELARASVAALLLSACSGWLPCDGPTAPGDVVGMFDAVGLAIGFELSCAVRATGGVACWGNDRSGQVGDGAQIDRTGPTDVVGITDAVEVATDSSFACALHRDGRVSCWGSNLRASLGTPLIPHCSCRGAHCAIALMPVSSGGITDATQIAAGAGHVCALRAGGTVACWGDATAGSLGDGLAHHEDCNDFDLSVAPVALAGVSDAVEITPRCARRATGAVVCWGSFTGDGTEATNFVPAPVVGLTDAVELASGIGHTCARRADGRVVCWGFGLHGELGDGATMTRLSPVTVLGVSDALEITAGGEHTCARRASDVICWGANDSGQLGDGTLVDRSVPTEVTGLGVVTHIAAGFDHTCALLPGGAVSCWGSNHCGELGDGTQTQRLMPGDVLTR